MSKLFCDVVNGVVVRGPSTGSLAPYRGTEVAAVIVNPQLDEVFEVREGPFVEITDDLVTYAYKAVSASVDGARENLKQMLADIRYRHETTGMTGVDTSRDSQGMIAAAGLAALLDPAKVTRFKGMDGEVVFNSVEMKAFALTVSRYVQSCFDNELDLIAVIDAAITVDQLKVIDINYGWPSG